MKFTFLFLQFESPFIKLLYYFRRLEEESDNSPVVKKEDVKLPFIEVKDDIKLPFVDKKDEEDVYIFPERKPDPITPRPLPQRPTLTDLTVAPPRHLSAELTPPRPLPADLKPPISLLNNLNPPNKQPTPVRPARPLKIDLTPPNQPSRPLPGQLQKPNIPRKPEKNLKKPIFPKPGKFQGPNKSNIPKFQKLMEQANRFQNPSKLSPFQINKLLEGRRFDQNADMLIRDQARKSSFKPRIILKIIMCFGLSVVHLVVCKKRWLCFHCHSCRDRKNGAFTHFTFRLLNPPPSLQFFPIFSHCRGLYSCGTLSCP